MDPVQANSPAVVATPSEELIDALQHARAFDHAVKYIRLLQTHISWVLLTGDYAYKIKKPVNFGFVDFSTLALRKFFCEEELQLNRRFASDIYLESVAIRDDGSGPTFFGEGRIVDYAVKMREFDQQDLLSAYASDGRLSTAHIDVIATEIARLHEIAKPADAHSDFGATEQLRYRSSENFEQIEKHLGADHLPARFAGFRESYLAQIEQLEPTFEQRRHQGFVRDCHGDLHLDNMAMLDGQLTLFDCIEFNSSLRWIDCISEAAFVAMDLQARGYPAFGWRFINQYLEINGDYAAMPLLRYYLIYRALVRAKVAVLGASLPGDSEQHLDKALSYIDLAMRWADDRRPGLVLMHGLSGSGKSTSAARLAEAIGAIQVRSDVERKRLFGYRPQQSSGAGLEGGIYGASSSDASYSRLLEITDEIIRSGFCVIVDASFLQAERRAAFLQLASDHSLRAVVIDCEAPTELLRQRIVERIGDASEASLQVLDRQLVVRQPLTSSERGQAYVLSCPVDGLASAQLEQIARWLAG
ncbi:MAG: aminoglycoside phosphotransferase family enzyme/predicted kinase [Planctomycetota bacterium]|jgi:aminoglycoside phosphotransferase family enzyme/predicted kinase